MSKLFDLNLDHKFSDDYDKNLDEIYKSLVPYFHIKYNEYYIPMEIRQIVRDDLKFYEILHYDKEHKTIMSRFHIMFINTFTFKHDGTVDLSSIRKFDDIPGKIVVDIAIKLCKIIKMKKIILFDDAMIYCPEEYSFNLSFIKLIETGKTFYEEFGFKPMISMCHNPYFKYSSVESLMTRRNKLISEIRAIKMVDIIKLCEDAITILKQDDSAIVAITGSLIDTYIVDREDVNKSRDRWIGNYTEMIRTMKVSKKELFGDFLVDLCRMNCDKYGSIIGFIMGNRNNLYAFKNNDVFVEHKYVKLLCELNSIKKFYLYELLLK